MHISNPVLPCEALQLIPPLLPSSPALSSSEKPKIDPEHSRTSVSLLSEAIAKEGSSLPLSEHSAIQSIKVSKFSGLARRHMPYNLGQWTEKSINKLLRYMRFGNCYMLANRSVCRTKTGRFMMWVLYQDIKGCDVVALLTNDSQGRKCRVQHQLIKGIADSALSKSCPPGYELERLTPWPRVDNFLFAYCHLSKSGLIHLFGQTFGRAKRPR